LALGRKPSIDFSGYWQRRINMSFHRRKSRMTEDKPASGVDCMQALCYLQAIAALGFKYPDLLKTLGRLIDEGTPIPQVDRSSAIGARDGVPRYKLADEVKAILAAIEAGDLNAHKVKSCPSHDGHPSRGRLRPGTCQSERIVAPCP
jgi:hypothetical protein